ncbi:syndecan-2 isoform X2 [Pyxicephalus adspersus]|uniref:syndecan-2 isoform X2 n=1 Tax=Pyxicephalus adspersus TaxID=30357 RepID=UPI003B5BD73B
MTKDSQSRADAAWLTGGFFQLKHQTGLSDKRVATTSDKDLYIDNTSIEESSGVYPIDDDDYSSGSGSGVSENDAEEVPVQLTTLRSLPESPPTSDAPVIETTTLKMQTKLYQPEVRKSDEPVGINPNSETDVYTEKQSENLFHRTEVLAAVIAGGGIGFLFAVFLILLLVYRMRKKDEGSYDLGERKPSSAVYQKAPTKEFYA